MSTYIGVNAHFSTKDHEVRIEFCLTRWEFGFSKSKSTAVKQLSLGIFHISHINYKKMNMVITDLINQYEMGMPDTEQYMNAELENNSATRSLN